MQHETRAHGLDIAVIDVHEHRLNCNDIGSPGLSVISDSSGHDKKRQSGRRGSGRFGDKIFCQRVASEKEGRARRLCRAALFRELSDRHPSFAIAEQNVRKDCDRGMIRTQCRRDIRSGTHDQPHFAAGRPERPFA